MNKLNKDKLNTIIEVAIDTIDEELLLWLSDFFKKEYESAVKTNEFFSKLKNKGY